MSKGIKQFISHITLEKIIEFKKLLLRWNKSLNLISNSTLKNIINRHILDSLQLLNFFNKSSTIIDLGSGAGFPGIVLAIAGVKNVTLIESNAKKSAFLFHASKLFCKDTIIINDRIENIDNLHCEIVTSRALGNLCTIFQYSSKIKIKKKLLLHKGSNYKKEIIQAQKHWLFNKIVHDSLTSKTGKILEINNITHRS